MVATISGFLSAMLAQEDSSQHVILDDFIQYVICNRSEE